MFKVLVLILVLAAASALRLGADPCTWGPSHWCKSVENAKKCNTETHCRTKVWVGDHPLAHLTKPIPETNVIPERKPENNGNCAICELIGKKIVSYMTDNATEAEAVAELEAFCQIMPEAEKQGCISFMDSYGKQFYELLVSDMNVKEICQIFGFCTEEFLKIMREGQVLTNLLKSDYRGIGCDTCQAAISLVQKEAKDNEGDLEKLVDRLCRMLPVDEKECDQIVNSIFEGGIEYFESLTPEEACGMIGLCKTLLYDIGIGPVQLGQTGQTYVIPENNLGTNKSCQNGPAFWCASEENAKLCDAVEYCKKEDAPIVF